MEIQFQSEIHALVEGTAGDVTVVRLSGGGDSTTTTVAFVATPVTGLEFAREVTSLANYTLDLRVERVTPEMDWLDQSFPEDFAVWCDRDWPWCLFTIRIGN